MKMLGMRFVLANDAAYIGGEVTGEIDGTDFLVVRCEGESFDRLVPVWWLASATDDGEADWARVRLYPPGEREAWNAELNRLLTEPEPKKKAGRRG